MAQVFKHYLVQQETLNTTEAEPILLAPSFSEEELSALKHEAYQQGYVQGAEEARALAHLQTHELEERLKQLIQAIPQAIEQNRLDMKQDLSALSLLIMERFFTEQCTDIKALETQINQILTQLNQQQQIELSLHPEDVKALQKGLMHLKATPKHLTIKQDESMTLGGFIIKTPHGIFDARIEQQIDQLKEYLIQIKQRGKA
jgi:flagellar assembly protein FliH